MTTSAAEANSERPSQIIPALVNRYLHHRCMTVDQSAEDVLACLLRDKGFMILPVRGEHDGQSPSEIGAQASNAILACATFRQKDGVVSFKTPHALERPKQILADSPIIIDFQMGEVRQLWALVGLDGYVNIDGVDLEDAGHDADMLQVYRVDEDTMKWSAQDHSSSMITNQPMSHALN